MALIPWTRRDRSELARFGGRMDDLFNGLLAGFNRPFLGQEVWPAIDVAEQDGAIMVRAEVPGCKPEDIDVSVYGDTLTISGQKKDSREERSDGYYHVESCSGSFRREIQLPTDVEPDKIEAVYKDGVLSVTLPKAAQSKARKVTIKG